MFKKLTTYVKDAYNELKNKVSWPTWKELQSSAILVMVTSIILALVIFAMDFVFQHLMEAVYNIIY